jgi:signal transduction histidine kinase
MMTTVRDSAFSLLQIINDILDLSKIEAGKLELEKAPFSIRDVVEGVADTMVPTAEKADVRFVCFIDPKIPSWVLSDQVRLSQILFNLLGNAIKFTTSEHGNKGLVKLVVELEGASGIKASEAPVKDDVIISFSIIDNGIGIGMSKDAVNNLFKPITPSGKFNPQKVRWYRPWFNNQHETSANNGRDDYRR